MILRYEICRYFSTENKFLTLFSQINQLKSEKMAAKKVTINLTGIMIKDAGDRGYTAYFAEFPEAIADGSSMEDTQENLLEAFKVMLETRKLESYPDDKLMGGIIQQNFEFELA